MTKEEAAKRLALQDAAFGPSCCEAGEGAYKRLAERWVEVFEKQWDLGKGSLSD